MSVSRQIKTQASLDIAAMLDNVRYSLTRPRNTSDKKPPTFSDSDLEKFYHPYFFAAGAKKLVKKVKVKAKDNKDETKTAAAEFQRVVIAQKHDSSNKVTTTGKPLLDGLSIVHRVGNNKYEIVNLENISLKTLRSEGAGLGLANNVERANAFYIRGSEWADAVEKCALASRYSDKHIFPFMKLPAEIRKMILELLLVVPKALFRRQVEPRADVASYLRVSKQLHKECKPLFWQNEIRVTFAEKGKRDNPRKFAKWGLADNIQRLSCEWRGMFHEGKFFAAIAEFPELKYLKLELCKGLEMVKSRVKSRKGNKMYQDDESIKVFSGQNAFDKLVEIRGLESVQVFSVYQPARPLNVDSDITWKEAVKNLEVFLNNILTQPKVKKVN